MQRFYKLAEHAYDTFQADQWSLNLSTRDDDARAITQVDTSVTEHTTAEMVDFIANRKTFILIICRRISLSTF